ncbi:DUF3619 family protein [Roseateles violae]|uniref:DUF3619 family protein n=1 Tax=Roseateles violae TaxID=3058042 RepID=A0ABT8DZF0_9BURK|nr:DUF3619 family protein [Pelomonas sp. PFR6]MDN3922976.1 DUF3619 family protein [Pelomonas sp. PFR6]
MNKQLHTHFGPELEARTTRFGLRVAAGLSERSEALPHDVSERLRFAREQALQRAQSARKAAVGQTEQAVQTVRSGSALALGGLGGGSSRWLKFASFLPLFLLVVGLLLIQHGQWYEQILAAAEVDTALLSDNLPPAAYGDPGFSEYLNDDEQQE